MRKYSKKPNNKGFTLVEMVVAFAVLAVIVLTVTLVVGASSNTYTKIATDINLQYESQLAMSQLQEYIIDCNASMDAPSYGADTNNNSLYIVNKTGDTEYTAYKLAKKSDSKELYFYKKTINTDSFSPSDPGNFTFDDSAGELMSSYVEAFKAEVTAASVTITIQYDAGGKTYTGKQTFALRNQIDVNNV